MVVEVPDIMKNESFFEMRKARGFRTYTTEDCVKIVQDFYATHRRVPQLDDIVALSKQKRSPSEQVFREKGGLNYIIRQAKLDIAHKHSGVCTHHEMMKKLRNFVSNFRASHGGKFPTADDCKKELGIQTSTFRATTKMTYFEALLELGAPVRRGKLANLPSPVRE